MLGIVYIKKVLKERKIFDWLVMFVMDIRRDMVSCMLYIFIFIIDCVYFIYCDNVYLDWFFIYYCLWLIGSFLIVDIKVF